MLNEHLKWKAQVKTRVQIFVDHQRTALVFRRDVIKTRCPVIINLVNL